MAQLLKGSLGKLSLWGIYVVLFVTTGRAQDVQDSTTWMKDAKWSVMTHYLVDWIPDFYSESMSVEQWNGLADHLDMEGLNEGVETSANSIKKAVLQGYFVADNVHVYDAVATTELSTDEKTKQLILNAASIRPSPQQLAWQQMEFIAFIHFTINTFENLVALVIEPSQATLYLNGLSSTNEITHQRQSLQDINLGRDAAGTYFRGVIDDVRIYNQALSEAEIAYLADVSPGDGKLHIPVQSPAELYSAEPQGSQKVDLNDFTMLAQGWLEQILWP